MSRASDWVMEAKGKGFPSYGGGDRPGEHGSVSGYDGGACTVV
jgi:hypothetical protein